MSSYHNITLVGPTQEHIVSTFNDSGRVAYLFSARHNTTIVYLPWSGYKGNEHASELAKQFRCYAYAIFEYDGEIWLYWLYNENGELIDEYNSNPAHGQDNDGQLPPSGGNAALLCTIFLVPEKTEQVAALIHEQDAFVDGKLVGKRYFPEVVPQEVAALLGISIFAASWTYEGINGCINEGIEFHRKNYPELASFVKTGGDTGQS